MGQDIHMAIEIWRNGKWTLQPNMPVCDDRNYLLFSILDGRSVGRIPCIAHSRGCPIDADPNTRDFLEDTHSASWLLLSEIRAFNWDTKWGEDSIIDLEYYSRWREIPNKEPQKVLSRSVAKGYNLILPSQADKYLKNWDVSIIKSEGWDTTLPFAVSVHWTIECKEVARNFIEWINNVVSKIDEGNAVRLVFGFDS